MSFFSKILQKVYLYATKQLYHSFAWAYDGVAWLVSFGYWSHWRLDVLNYISEGQSLEIGFGTGELLIEMTRRRIDVIGLEKSRQMHRLIQKKIQRRGLAIACVRGSAATLPFASGSFSNVISTFPSAYIFQKTVTREVCRVLSSDGRWVILGLRVDLKSPIKSWLTRWFLGQDISVILTKLFTEAKAFGFRGKIIEHQAEDYSLPVIILERRND